MSKHREQVDQALKPRAILIASIVARFRNNEQWWGPIHDAGRVGGRQMGRLDDRLPPSRGWFCHVDP